eukprot:CAMPEP_0197609052 /NCGR_PEP_ID=MMETSP1326-20131121/50373_1 /TAXON_ID=1155430 /ORGANISM="Genus nov. species nov., Strain RCC2288" /LENGTH=51 /DNA_ID=CAMNT_0043177361 /DNA_START=74 /DNA_END=226 /DNA_ORIENTATION=+
MTMPEPPSPPAKPAPPSPVPPPPPPVLAAPESARDCTAFVATKDSDAAPPP